MDLYYFNNKEELLGIIPAERQIRHEQTQVLNGLISIYAEVLYDKRIEEAAYIGHKDVDDDSNFHLYYIDQMRIDSNILIIEGTHVFFDDLQADVVRDMRPQNLGVGVVLSRLLEGTRWELGQVNSSNTASSNFYYISKLEAFWKAIEAWRVEFKPRLAFSGSKITRRYLDISDKTSDDYGKRYEYGDKLLHIVKETAKESIFTAFVGRGKGEEKFDEETGQATGGYGRRIGFEDVEWSVASGDPIDKPKGIDFIEFKEATEIFGYSNGKARVRVELFEDIEDPEELLRATYELGLVNSRPHVQFKSNVYDKNVVELGETVTIIRDDLGIRYKTRVFKLTRDFLLRGKKVFEFGEKLTESTASRAKSLKNDINRQEEARLSLAQEMMRQLTLSFFNEDGYNYNFHAGNEYGLPGGYYSFDMPIDMDPAKVVYMGAGKILIANSKNPDGSWEFRTAATGDGVVASAITTGVLDADLMRAGSLVGKGFRLDLDKGGFDLADKIKYDPVANSFTIDGDVLIQAINGGAYRIQGSSIVLDGNVDMKSSFKVPSGNIGNLTAGHITTGTLTVNSSGTHTGSLNNSSATLGGSYKSANITGSSTSFNADSSLIEFIYGSAPRIRVSGRVDAQPSGNHHSLELNGLSIDNGGGTFKRTSSSVYTLYASGTLDIDARTVRINGKEIYDNGNGGWASR